LFTVLGYRSGKPIRRIRSPVFHGGLLSPLNPETSLSVGPADD
jgi:hypothetical protein